MKQGALVSFTLLDAFRGLRMIIYDIY